MSDDGWGDSPVAAKAPVEAPPAIIKQQEKPPSNESNFNSGSSAGGFGDGGNQKSAGFGTGGFGSSPAKPAGTFGAPKSGGFGGNSGGGFGGSQSGGFEDNSASKPNENKSGGFGSNSGGGFENKSGGFGGNSGGGFGGNSGGGFGGNSGGGSENKSGGFGGNSGGGFENKSGGFGGNSGGGFGGNSGGGFGGSSGGGSENKSGGFGGNSGGGFENKSGGFGGNSGGGFGNKSGGFGSKSNAFDDNSEEKSSGFGNSSGGRSNGFGNSSGGKSGSFGNNSGSGFGNNSGGGFGGGKSNGFGNDSGSGFGGKSGGGGFGGNSDGFNSGSGFGGKSEEFGSGSGFGGKSGGFGGGGSGFGGGSSSFGGGGFGGGGGSDSFGGGRSNSSVCFNCQEEGHRSNECPNPKKERSSKCFNCDQEGHRSSDCPEPRKERGGGGGGNNNCFNCNQEGHRSNECPEPRKERSMACFNCNEDGHRSSECPHPRKPREDGEPVREPSTFIPPELTDQELFSDTLEKGALFEKFFEATVQVTRGGIGGSNCQISPIKSFEELNLTPKLQENVQLAHYSKPTPVQQYAMPIIKDGNDIMSCAQTGSGKTAAFLLPIMHQLLANDDLSTSGDEVCSPRCLIIAPTRELAEQIYREGKKFAYKTVMTIKRLIGGTSVQNSLDQLREGATILVGTPGRLEHFINDNHISMAKIRFFVLDEADRMLDMGFTETIDNIARSLPPKNERQTLMFSATFQSEVQTSAQKYLKESYVFIAIGTIGGANSCITQEFILCEKREKKDKLLELLNVDLESYSVNKESDIYKKKTIIFVSKKVFADTLGGILSSANLPATTIHGDRKQNERNEAITQFKQGRKPILIATAVAERGLDIKGVDHVINYDLPDNIDDYVHRIGRTGRVGNSGRATSFFVGEDDSRIAPALVRILSDAQQIVPDWLEQFQGGGGCFGGTSGGNAFAETEDW